MKKIVFLLVLFANTILAQSIDDIFYSANDFYKNEKFDKAIELYHQIESKGTISVELYYNLGNSYYKINKVGPSIYYFEKALKLDPTNEDAQNNLIFAKRLALDNIQEIPKNIFQKINANYLQKLSYNQWAIVSVVFSFLACILFLLFYFANSPTIKRIYFGSSISSFLLLIICFSITYNQYSFSQNNKEAIVFAETSTVKNAPTFNSEEVFILHEGTKVIVLDRIDNWKKIKLADGKQGWIIAKEIKEI
ncbi:tetratricopeptide repeat protein [Polaribacter sp.]|uniref:tetratricopeptide repeat protein n=1 Tax=Polaribacter sp. TaxID=1920175 RepID=UPI0040483B86